MKAKRTQQPTTLESNSWGPLAKTLSMLAGSVYVTKPNPLKTKITVDHPQNREKHFRLLHTHQQKRIRVMHRIVPK